MKYQLRWAESHHPVYQFEVDNGYEDKIALSGDLFDVDCSYSNYGDDREKEFMFGCYYKWDSCSHWGFYGQDFLYDEEDKDKRKKSIDGYYHLCGGNMILSFWMAMAFVIKVAEMHITNCNFDKSELENIKEISDILLKGYEIVEV